MNNNYSNSFPLGYPYAAYNTTGEPLRDSRKVVATERPPQQRAPFEAFATFPQRPRQWRTQPTPMAAQINPYASAYPMGGYPERQYSMTPQPMYPNPEPYPTSAPAAGPSRPRTRIASVTAVERSMQAMQLDTQATSYSPPSEDWAIDISAADDLKREAVRDLLKQTHTLRMGVECARGRGSVAAFMYALKEILYQARQAPGSRGPNIQVVYQNGAEHNLQPVLGPSFNPQLPRQRILIEGTSVLFVKEGHLQAKDKGSGLTLGYVAANDGPDHHAHRWLDVLSSDDAGEVFAVGVGQPYDWAYGGGQCVLFRSNNDQFQKHLKGIPDGYPIRIPEISAADLSKELQFDPDGRAASSPERLALAHVFWKLHRAKADVMPIYGLHHPNMKKEVGREDELIRNLCGGIREAQRNGLQSKPTILVVIGDYSQELRHFGENPVSSRHNPNQVVYAGDRDSAKNVSQIKDGQIFLLYAGKVEQRYFQQLFRLSTLPPVIEGANSANMCQNIEGKAYLHMSMDGTKFLDTSSERTGMRQARDLSSQLQNNDFRTRDVLRQNLGKFIIDSKTPNSNVSRYFGEVHNKSTEKNQIVEVLSHIVELRELGAEIKKPTWKWSKKSSSNIDYELWSDGKLFYKKPNGERMRFFLDGLSSLDETGFLFAHTHFVPPKDLFITDVTFAKKTFLSRSKPSNPVIRMTAPNGNSFDFELDEFNDTLTLVKKNDRPVSSEVYKRNTAADRGLVDERYAGPAVLRKSRK
ncbi:MAG: large repetitive protein [Paraburkholderia sp.]|nr:large repetitive protein [Paraburkholderia sp.]